MKIVINDNWGGYGYKVSAEYKELVEKYEHDRTNPELVALVENNCVGDLVVVEIPDGATDWYINEYDGAETVVYVLNGKLYYAEYELEDDDD